MAPKTKSKGKAKATPRSGSEETQGTSRTSESEETQGTQGTSGTKRTKGTSGTKRTKRTQGTSGTGGRKPKDASSTSNQNTEEVMIQQKDASQQEPVESLQKENSGPEATALVLQKELDSSEMIQQKEAQLASKQEEIVSMQREIIDLKGTIGDLKETIGDLKGTIGGLKGTIGDLKGTISEKDKTISEKDKTIAEKDKTISELERKHEPHQDTIFDKFKACCSKVGKYMGFMFPTQHTNTSRLNTHKMKAISKVESIESMESSKKVFKDLVETMNNELGHILKKEKFLSVTVTEFLTTTGYAAAHPLDETELSFYVHQTMEIPALIAASVIYEEVFGRKGIISHGRAKVEKIEQRIYRIYTDYRKDAGRPETEMKMINNIKNLKPDGFIYLNGRSNPFLICEYKATNKITEANYDVFNYYLKKFTEKEETKATMFYKYSELLDSEKNPSFTNFMELFEQINTYMTKYGSVEGFVTSGSCWIFFLGDPDKPAALKHYPVFVEDEESWIEAFEILLAMLLKPLLDYKGEKKWDEWIKQDNPITKIKEKYESFTKDRDWKPPKNTNDDNGDDGDNGDNGGNGDNEDIQGNKENESYKGDRNDKDNTVNQNNPPSEKPQKSVEFESFRELKKQPTLIYTKQKHEILPLSEQNFNVLQQYPKNGNKKKTAEKKDEKVTLQPSGQNTTTSTSTFETSNKPKDPLARYCTQKCLLGLKKNLPMDKKCPNYNIHKQNSNNKNNLHPINCNTLVSLFRKQLESDKVKIEYYVAKEGAVGQMVKITVYPYGYTVVGKHRTKFYDYYADVLKYEAAIYKQLEDLQGKWIPVCLGYVETDDEACILLSYGGETAETEKDYNQDTVWKIASLLSKHGVSHNDIRPSNVLLNKELGHEMLIDFHVSDSNVVDMDDFFKEVDGKYLW